MAKVALFQIDGWEAEHEIKQLKDAGLDVDVYKEGVDKAKVSDPAAYEAISVFVGPTVNKEVIDSFSNLKLITTRSTGFDHIDLAHARQKKLALGFVPHYGENTVAEHAMGLILTLTRKIYWGIDRIKETKEFSFEGLEGIDLKGKVLGVVGTGRIGAHVIKMAQGFDMKVIGYDAFPNDDLAKKLGFSYTKTLDELLEQSDIVTIHVPYLPDTHHLINKDNIEKMKEGSYLINTARGAVVETKALILALQKGTLAGAGLDVLEEEGVAKDEQGFWMRDADDDAEDINLRTVLENSILMDMPNVVITPHNAFNTKEAKLRILGTDIENITQFFKTGEPKEPIPDTK